MRYRFTATWEIDANDGNEAQRLAMPTFHWPQATAYPPPNFSVKLVSVGGDPH